jgi:hypothetical protein
MDRGIPTEKVLEEMRQSAPPVKYLVGTPKGRLNRGRGPVVVENRFFGGYQKFCV